MQVETYIQLIIDTQKKSGWIKTPEEEADLRERLWRAAFPPKSPNEETADKCN